MDLRFRQEVCPDDLALGAPPTQWILGGPAGYVHFTVGRFPEHAQETMRMAHERWTANVGGAFPCPTSVDSRGSVWIGIELAYHSPRPMPEVPEPIRVCELLPVCYYQATSQLAHHLCQVWLDQDQDAEVIRKVLRAEYEDVLMYSE